MKNFNASKRYDSMNELYDMICDMISKSNYGNNKVSYVSIIKYMLLTRKILKRVEKYILRSEDPLYVLFYDIIHLYKVCASGELFKDSDILTAFSPLYEYNFNYDYNSYSIKYKKYENIINDDIEISSVEFILDGSDIGVIAVKSNEDRSVDRIFRLYIEESDRVDNLYMEIESHRIKKICIGLLRRAIGYFTLEIINSIYKFSYLEEKNRCKVLFFDKMRHRLFSDILILHPEPDKED